MTWNVWELLVHPSLFSSLTNISKRSVANFYEAAHKCFTSSVVCLRGEVKLFCLCECATASFHLVVGSHECMKPQKPFALYFASFSVTLLAASLPLPRQRFQYYNIVVLYSQEKGEV